MTAQVKKLRIRPTIKNPLSEKLKEKKNNFLSKNYIPKTFKNCKTFPK